MIARALFLALALLSALASPALAAGPAEGTIEGQLVNGTDGGSSVAGQEVTLETYVADETVGTATTSSDAQGKFRFTGLPTAPDHSYMVTVSYQGADYDSDPISFAEGETTRSIEVAVFDSTTSDDSIRIATAHMIIYPEQDTLLVTEYFVFFNQGDRTYIGPREAAMEGQRETLRLSLPPEASGLQVSRGLMECCLLSTEEGLVDTMPVLPGGKEVSFSYRLPSTGRRYDFDKVLHYPAASYQLVARSDGVDVACSELVRQEPLEIDGERFLYLSGENLPRRTELTIRIAGLPGADSEGVYRWLAIALMVLAASFAFGYPLAARPQAQPPRGRGRSQAELRLLAELADLDDDYEAGRLSGEDYREQRSAKKAHLLELKKQPPTEGK